MFGRFVTASVVLGLAACAAAQSRGSAPPPQIISAGFWQNQRSGDINQLIATGGVRYFDAKAGFDVRADRAILIFDQDESVAAIRAARGRSALPRRRTPMPDSRRAIDESTMRERLLSFLSSASSDPVDLPPAEAEFDAFRSIYLEGEVTLVQDGVETIQASAMYFSTLENRLVLRDVTLRLSGRTSEGDELQLTLRSKELLRQDGRFVGRNTSITGCPAGEPQWDVFTEEIEIIEKGEEFEIRSRGSNLGFFGSRLIPVPNQSWSTATQSNMLIKDLSVGNSQVEGIRVRAEVGSSFNELGGAIHEAVTGRSADEFRGDWRLGVGWIQERGVPVDGQLEYEVTDSYYGRAMGFGLSDGGENFRDITTDINGNVIDNTGRWLAQTENRIFFGDSTTVDLTLFGASDEAVYSEFFRERYYVDERPESSIIARDAKDNLLAMGTMRWNMTSFSYGSGRNLSPVFQEELPNLTLDLFNEPLVDLPGDTSLFVSSNTGLAQFNRNYDDKLVGSPDEESWRVKQELEFSVPFQLGAFALRAFVLGGFAYYSDTPTGEADENTWLEGGAEFGTQLSRVWRWFSEAGEAVAVRHTMSPTIRYEDRWHVARGPGELYQFTDDEALTPGSNIRVGLLQRFQHSSHTDETRDVTEFAWLDLAQNIKPNPDRDNNGNTLGLAEFDLRLRPRPEWLRGIPDLRFVIEGQYDWEAGETRTWNNAMFFRTGGIQWFGEYRSDAISGGVVGAGASIPVLRRWELFGRTQYDIQLDRTINYIARLTRRDLNWNLALELAYDSVTDDTSFRIAFTPTFGGMFDDRGGDYLRGVPFGADNYSSY